MGRDVWLLFAVAIFEAMKDGRFAWLAAWAGRLGIDIEVRLEPVDVSDPDEGGR